MVIWTTGGTGDFEVDMQEVINLCGRWWEDSLFYKKYGYPYNVDTRFFRSLAGHGLIYKLGRVDGKLIACYVGIKQPYMFNRDVLCATEIVWCVDKDNRSLPLLFELLEQVRSLMEEYKIDMYGLTVSNEPKFRSLEKILKRKGYEFMDRMYTKGGIKAWRN